MSTSIAWSAFQGLMAQSIPFASRTYTTAFLLTMNTNSTNINDQLTDDAYKDAFDDKFMLAVKFPRNFLFPYSNDPNFVKGSNFVLATSNDEINLWKEKFEIKWSFWGGSYERGDNQHRYHMHAVVVVEHLNYMQIDKGILSRLIQNGGYGIRYVRCDFIKDVGAIKAIFYANKSRADRGNIETIILRNKLDRSAVIAELREWYRDYQNTHTSANDDNDDYFGDNNNNNDYNRSNNNNIRADGSGGGSGGGGGGGGVALARQSRPRQRVRDDLSMWSRSLSAPARVIRATSTPGRQRVAAQSRPVTRAQAAQSRPITRSVTAKRSTAAPRGRPRSTRR